MKRRRDDHTVVEDRVSEVRADELPALLAASRAVNSSMGLEDVLLLVLRNARELLGAHEGSVMLLDSEDHLRIVAGDGIPDEVISTTHLALGEGVAGKVAQTGEPMLLDSPPDRREFSSFVEVGRPLLSAVSVPLQAADRIVGVLNLNIVEGTRRFSQEDLRLAQVFGEHAAMAIQKARLLQRANRRGEDLGQLLEASRELIGAIEVETLLTRVLDASGGLVGSRAGFIGILDERSERLVLGVYQGLARHEIREALGRQGFLELFSEDSEPRDVEGLEALQGIASKEDRVLALSTRAEGKSRALLLLFSEDLDPHGADLCRAFFEQAGTAIRNAQLYRQVGDKESELASIIYSIENPVLVVDPGGRIVIANPAAEELFGFTADFSRGRPVGEVLEHPELEALVLGHAEGTAEVVLGSPVALTWKAKASPIRTPEGGQSGRILVLDDVSAERDAERMKTDFVAVIGHELRTPLTLIKGYLKTLLRLGDTLDNDKRIESLLTADAQAQKLERLIEDLLFVSHIETSRPPLHLEEVDLSLLSHDLIEEFRARESARDFWLEVPESYRVVCDRTKVEQTIFHLLDNACKYSDDDAEVSLQIVDRPEHVEVAVIDRGVGILSDDLRGLFERFHQVDSTSTREHGGTGVGLYICKRFVEAHGGRIWAQSAWGKGSTFRFTLPKNVTAVPRER